MAENLPFGEIRPQARPIGAFVQPARQDVAAAAQPSQLGNPTGINTIQMGSAGNVQGYNQQAQLAEALAPFSRELMKAATTGYALYAKDRIEEGYYDELKNQQGRSAMSLQMQQEQGAVNAGNTISELAKRDPQAAQMLNEANPWRLIGRRRALAQLAGNEINSRLEDDLAKNPGLLSGIEPGSPVLMQRKDQFTQSALTRYGLTGDELEAQFYTVPKLNQAWEKYADQQRSLFSKTLTQNTIDAGTALLSSALERLGTEGVALADGTVVQMGDVRWPRAAATALTEIQDKQLLMLGGSDRSDAIKRWQGQLLSTFGQAPQLAQALQLMETGPAFVEATDDKGNRVLVRNTNRPTWGGSAPFDMLKLQNEGNGQRLLQFEQGQKTIEQKLDEAWYAPGGPASMLPTDPGYAPALLAQRNLAAQLGYRDIDGWLQKRISSLESVTADVFGPNPLDAADFLQEIDDLPRSAFNTSEGIQSLRQRAREIYRADPEGYKQALATIDKKAEQAAQTTPGLQQEIDRALLQDLTLPQVKPLVDKAKSKGSTGNAFQQLLTGNAGAVAAIGSLGEGNLQAFSIRINNLYLRNAEAKIDKWMAERPGVPLSSSARNVLINEAIAETRKTPEYAAAFEELTGKKPGQVGPGKVGTGPSQGTQPGPQNRGVPRAAASSLPDSTVKGFAVRPVMDGNWLHSELENVANGKPVSPQLYQLAVRAKTSTNRLLLEQLRFYPQLDEGGEARRFLEGQIKKQRAGQTVSSANYSGATRGLGMLPTGYNPMAPGSWLMNLIMPPAAAATLPAGYAASYSGGSGGGSFEKPVSVVYERPDGQPGVDLYFPSKRFPAVLGGVVKDVSRESGYGNYVVIESVDPATGRKVDVLYGHLADGVSVRRGQRIQPGQIIGQQGGTGNVRSADGTIASIDFFEPRPAGSRDMTPYSGFDALRRRVVRDLQSGGGPRGGGGGASPGAREQGYLKRLSYLETRIRNIPNAEGSPGRGYFQAFPTFASEAIAASGGIDPRDANYDRSAKATWAWIVKHRPAAADAIRRGDYDTADRILRPTWPSLPGGSQAQPDQVQRESRRYLRS